MSLQMLIASDIVAESPGIYFKYIVEDVVRDLLTNKDVHHTVVLQVWHRKSMLWLFVQ